jgi:hypothetical protein
MAIRQAHDITPHIEEMTSVDLLTADGDLAQMRVVDTLAIVERTSRQHTERIARCNQGWRVVSVRHASRLRS